MTHPLIAAALAAPKTHMVITTYADGHQRIQETRGRAAAENHAIGERRKIGRDLIDRTTGETVRVVGVEIEIIEGGASRPNISSGCHDSADMTGATFLGELSESIKGGQ